MFIKDFESWSKVKQELDKSKRRPTFKEREIWWCNIGMNIGYEIFGKDDKFWRPVLVLAKYSRNTFFGLPLTSTIKHDNKYFFPINFKNRGGSILLGQGRTLSSKRLSNIMGSISDNEFEDIAEAYIKLLIKKPLN